MKYTLVLILFLSSFSFGQDIPLTSKDSLLRIIKKVTVVQPVNQPPVASLGADMTITLPVNTVTISSVTSKDPDGTIVAYQYTQVSGPSPASLAPFNTACNIAGLTQGVYVFMVTITDNGGLKGSDNITVTVNPAVIPPTGSVKYLQLPAGTPQRYDNRSNLIIENLQFRNKNSGLNEGSNLRFYGCSNITIRNVNFGSSLNAAIYLYNCTNVRVENCLFAYNTTAILASTCKGGIKAVNCEYVNMDGKGTLGAGGGEFYKLIECSGPGNGVENCRGENFAGQSNPEDIISLYNSSGTSTSPIFINGNYFKGGGPSLSGGGIVAGDTGGGWVVITNNTVFNPGNYGIAAAGGHDIRIENNKIWSDQSAWSNNPLFYWYQGGSACSNITIINNRARWIDKSGNINPGWAGGGCTNVTFQLPTSITLAEMAVPAHLFKHITPAELVTVRASK